MKTNFNKNTLPVEVKKLLWDMNQGKIEQCITTWKRGRISINAAEAIKVIKDRLDYDVTLNSVNMMSHYLKEESDIYRSIRQSRKFWSPAEDKLCIELFLKLPPMSSHKTWKEIVLDPMDKAFPVRKHNKSCINSRMRRLGIKRKGNVNGTSAYRDFDYYAELGKPEWELNEHEEGVQEWIATHKVCGIKQKKSNFTSSEHFKCFHCSADPNIPSDLYETLVFSEEENRWVVKIGESIDPDKRIPTYGITRTGKVWPSELYPQLTKLRVKQIEGKVKEKFGEYKDPIPELIGNGLTECYNITKRFQIREYIDQLVLDAKSRIPQNIS